MSSLEVGFFFDCSTKEKHALLIFVLSYQGTPSAPKILQSPRLGRLKKKIIQTFDLF